MASTYNPSTLYVAPTLVVGLGGTGVKVVRLLKERVRNSINPTPGIIEFLAIDTEPFQNLPGEERIFDREFAYLGDYNAQSVLEKLNRHPHIEDWWFDQDDPHAGVTGSIHKGARQRRCIGRLSLYVKWGVFIQKLDPKIHKIRKIIEKEKAQRRGLSVERNTGLVQVYIISSVCGGTGSGILLDVAFRIRKELGDDADIVAVCLLPSCFQPEIQSRIQKKRIQGNAYASLREINYFLSGAEFEASFPDHAFRNANGKKIAYKLSRPFDSVYLVDRSNGRENLSSLGSVERMVGQYVFLDIITPIGKKFASRRANLRDLAGEQSKTGSLAFGGFVTASLVLPIETFADTITYRNMSDFIRRRLLGSPINDTTASAVLKMINDRYQVIDQALQFEKAPVAPIPGDLISLIAGTGSVATSIDLSTAQAVAEKVAEDLQALLQTQFINYGLRTLRFVVENLHALIDKRLKTLQRESVKLNDEIAQTQNSIKDEPPREKLVHRLMNVLNGLVSSGRTSEQHRTEAWVRKQKLLQAQVESQRLQLARTRKAVEILTEINSSLINLLPDLDQRINILVGIEQDLDKKHFSEQKEFGARSNGVIAQGLPDLFELATKIGDEGQDFQEIYEQLPAGSLIKQFLDVEIPHEKLRQEDEDLLLRKIAHAGLCNFTTGEQGIATINLDHKPEQLMTIVQNELYAAFKKHTHVISHRLSDVSVVKYLRWFYDHVQYDGHSSRNSPIDPLQMLRYRCTLPFLEVDEAHLGSDDGANTEDVRIVGLGQERVNDKLAEEVLDEFDSFEDVRTGIHDRLDISFSRHGYHVSALRQLREYKDSYLYFLRDVNEMLHIHRDWPRNMDDLVDPHNLDDDYIPPLRRPRPLEPEVAVLEGANGHPVHDLTAGNGHTKGGSQSILYQTPSGSDESISAAPKSIAEALLTHSYPMRPTAQSPTAPSDVVLSAPTLIQSSAYATDTGRVREHNEDHGLAEMVSTRVGESTVAWGLYAVADGMGGNEDGEVASDLAVKTIKEIVGREQRELAKLPDVSIDRLKAMVEQAVQETHEEVHKQARENQSDMQSTLTMALVVDNVAVIANVGDSRTYLWRNGKLRRITQDHSWVMRLVESNLLKEDQIYTHPMRNYIMEAIGGVHPSRPLRIDIFTEQLQLHDKLLLCSDGQWEMTRDSLMEEILQQSGDPEVACQRLIEAANTAGGEDNITALVVQFNEH